MDIRLYSIIYDAIEEVKAAMEGMLSPEIKEEVTATVEVRETFHISKVGTVAGGIVKEGKIKPALVIGVPVGFVNVVESKEIIMQTGIPYIVAVGRKGGSNVAAAICNALIYKLTR